MLKAWLGSSQRLSHSICLRKWDAQIPGRAGPLEVLGTFTVKAVKSQKSDKTWSQVEKQQDNANGRSKSWIYQAKNCAEGKEARTFPLVRGIIVQNTGKNTVAKQ